MDDLFAKMIDENMPKVNPYIMQGLAVVYMKQAEEYLDAVFRSASASFPAGLVYVGYERCTPEEEYLETTKIKYNKRRYDIAESDLYLVKYKFKFNDEDVPDRLIYLPYVSEGGLLNLSGARYHISPVLSDKVISPGIDTVFVRLLRDKIIFKRCYHNLVINGVRETTYVIHSQIYRKPKENKKVPPTTKAETCLSHYLFAKYGFTGTFVKYAGFEPIIGNSTTITEESYPADKWVICESAKLAPRTFMGKMYEATDVRLAIPLAKWNNFTKSLVAGLYYCLDHFPDRLKEGYLDSISLWKILLGHIVWSGLYGENKLYTNIEEHFSSLDNYVDTIVIEKLKENGKHVKDFYDILALILEEFNSLVLDKNQSSLSMFGKSAEILYYVFYEITSGLFRVNFQLGKSAAKKPLVMRHIVEAFNKNLKARAIYDLTSGKIICSSVSYSGDHYYPKITSNITEQESSAGSKRKSNTRVVIGEDKRVDISMLEAGSMLFYSKSNPTPSANLNPYAIIDLKTGTILPNPEFDDIRKKTEALLKCQ